MTVAPRRERMPRLLSRGLRRRCAVCGGGELFTSWSTMVESCPTCGRRFEREEGYWLGAMIVNIAVTEGLFVLVLVGGMVLTWPDVPWTPLLIVAIAVNIIVPILFYPRSKTIWVALDVGFLQQMEPGGDRDELGPRNVT